MAMMELRQKRHAIAEEARGILKLAGDEGRALTQEEQVKWDRMMADVDSLRSTIEAMEKQSVLDQEMNQRMEVTAKQAAVSNPMAPSQSQVDSAFRSWMINGQEGMTTEQRSILKEYRAQSTTGSAGGYTIPQGFYNQLIDGLKAFGGMREAGATILTTASGNTLPIPTVDDTSNVGAILAENTAASAQDLTFDQKTLGSYKYTSKVVLVSYELMQDSAFDMQTFLARKLAERIGRITNTHFTVGDGSSKPYGVVAGAALGKTGTTGQTTSVTYEDLVDLLHSVNRSYRTPNAAFMMSDSTYKAIRKLKDSEGLPLWATNVASGAPDTLLGARIVINDDVAAMAANAKSILYGDFSNYFIRDVTGVELYRISDKYIESGQVGFVAFSRHDGVLVNAGQNPIKYYANSAS
jgi:HK97 family phage major capsid protein